VDGKKRTRRAKTVRDGVAVSVRNGTKWGRRPADWPPETLAAVRALVAEGKTLKEIAALGVARVRVLRSVNEDGLPAFRSGKKPVREEWVETTLGETAIRRKLAE